MTPNPINAYKITIYTTNTPTIQKYISKHPMFSNYSKNRFEQTELSFLFYIYINIYISNFHNLYSVIIFSRICIFLLFCIFRIFSILHCFLGSPAGITYLRQARRVGEALRRAG